VQQTVQSQTVGIEWVRCQFPGKFSKLLLNFLRHAHIKDALHQRFDREKMRVDVLHISHRLLKRVSGLICTADRSGMHLPISGARAMLLL
tara:strand:+ start:1252 stop:1521 length:270 start_codon:yes stop_codon:yes gene_type:complete